MAAKHQEDQAAMKEQILDIPTKDGAIETFVCHPERGGPYPPVLFLMDAPGIREELYDMARRLATVGYYVLLPNLYYRAGKDTKYGADVLEKGSAEQARMRAVRTKMTIPPVMDDVAAMIAFADSQKESKKGPVGTHGYCMSGPYALAAAARYPDRIAAAASFYGTWLVSDAVESPHLTLGKAKGELYISCAEHDELAPPDMVEGAEGAVRQVGQWRRAGNPDGRPSRLRLPATLVLRQAGRRAPLGTPDRALSAAAGLMVFASLRVARGGARAAGGGVMSLSADAHDPSGPSGHLPNKAGEERVTARWSA